MDAVNRLCKILKKEFRRKPRERVKAMQFAVENLHKSFGEKQVLKDVSFSTESGKAFGLLGRNGAGKTTTIRIIMDVFPADSGKVLLNGEPMVREKVNVGYLPEERGLYPKVNNSGTAGVSGKTSRVIRLHDAKENSMKWLRRLSMDEYANKKLDTLSKGNQQKIQLTAALVSDPDFVILDEPFSGLDPVNAMLLKDVVRELIDSGKIVLFSSHQMNYVEEFCDSIAILHHGRNRSVRSIRELRHAKGRNNWLIQTGETEKALRFCRESLSGLVKNVRAVKEGAAVELVQEGRESELLSAVASSGLTVDGVQLLTPTLNDIFVAATGDDETEGSEGK